MRVPTWILWTVAVIGVALLAAGMLAALDLPVPGFPRAPAPHSPGWRR